MAAEARPGLVAALAALAAALLVLVTVAAYSWRVLYDSDRFADRAASVLQSDAARQAIADRVTDGLVLRADPDLLAARPIIASAVSGVVGRDAIVSLFRRAVRDVHAAVFDRDQDTVTLTLVDVGVLVGEAVRQARPELASEIESNRRVELLSRDLGAVTGDVARLARSLRTLTLVLVALMLAAAGAAVAVATDRRRAVSRLGVAIACAGVAVVVADIAARAIVLDRIGDPDDRALAAAVWDAFLGDLRTAGWLIAGTGAVVAAAVASLIRPVEVERPLHAAWRVVTTEPDTVVLRVARGAALVAAGALVIADPITALRIAATLVGVYVLYKGLEALLGPISRPAAEPAAALPRRRRRLAVPAVAALLVVAAYSAFAVGGGLDEPAHAVSGCNGHIELCDRPLDEVALPATHNAMSAPPPGWYSPLQEEPIERQLEDGIRALLLDTHYADRLPNGRTRTYFGSAEDFRATIGQDGVSDEGIAAAERLRERLGFRGSGERGMYLCHTFCELGATPLEDVLGQIHQFLVTHPSDVLVVINQDYVTPADFVQAVEDAGLARYAIEPPADDRWPTLRELMEQDRRLLVMAENEAGAAPWYQLAYERLTQETPFEFGSPSELTASGSLAASCRPNRGTDGAPVFLLNHWVGTDPVPRPSNAAIVNAFEPLLRRARACERSRGERVNLLAVDFYGRGDLFEVVDALNGV